MTMNGMQNMNTTNLVPMSSDHWQGIQLLSKILKSYQLKQCIAFNYDA